MQVVVYGGDYDSFWQVQDDGNNKNQQNDKIVIVFTLHSIVSIVSFQFESSFTRISSCELARKVSCFERADN